MKEIAVKIDNNKNNIIKKHQELIRNARYSLNEIEIKLVSTLIAMIKVTDDDFYKYAIDIKDLQQLTDSQHKDKKYYLDIAKGLMSKPFIIGNSVYNWTTYAEHEPNTSILKFEIHRNLKPYLLQLKNNFLTYDIKNILLLKSAYVIRLYELFVDKWSEYQRYNEKAKSYTFELDIKKLRELFEIPDSYQYSSHIKQHIIDKAKQQFKAKTDIQFEYKEQKIGRKVDRLIITIKENEKGSNNYLNNEKSFITHIRKKFVNQDLLQAIDKNNGKKIIISVSEKGILYDKFGQDFNASRSKEIWTHLYQLALDDKLICLKQGLLF